MSILTYLKTAVKGILALCLGYLFSFMESPLFFSLSGNLISEFAWGTALIPLKGPVKG